MEKAHRKLDPVTKSRLHEEIVTQIQRKIVAGEFAIGEKLPPERDIAQRLQVNRATLREALKKLELLGLVEIRHGDGIYVQNYIESGNLELLRTIIYMNDVISLDVLKNILEIRKILVPEMAYLAARHRTEAELKEMEDTLKSGEKSVLERDLQVHHIIARASRNLLYIFILNFFNQLFRDYGYLYFSNPANEKHSGKFHSEIYEAVARREGEKARKIMKDVLVYTEKQIYAYYRNTYEESPA
jgi:GntR family transcriptional repressor for pyruvate dehydrogenase complex